MSIEPGAPRVLFDDEVRVHHGFVHICPEDTDVDVIEPRAGQRNGLCGAAEPGVLAMVTGLHTGRVPLRVELHATAPELDESWEDVVEVSFRRGGGPYGISTFDEWYPLALKRAAYRVRWSATGMDAAHDLTRTRDEPALDRYLFQFWPARRRRDTVLRQTSATAARWHRIAAEAPVPEPPTVSVEEALSWGTHDPMPAWFAVVEQWPEEPPARTRDLDATPLRDLFSLGHLGAPGQIADLVVRLGAPPSLLRMLGRTGGELWPDRADGPGLTDADHGAHAAVDALVALLQIREDRGGTALAALRTGPPRTAFLWSAAWAVALLDGTNEEFLDPAEFLATWVRTAPDRGCLAALAGLTPAEFAELGNPGPDDLRDLAASHGRELPPGLVPSS